MVLFFIIFAKQYTLIKINMLEQEKSPFIIKELSNDSGSLMLQVLSLWENYHDRAIKKYSDLSYMQFSVLASAYWLILNSEKQVTQTILANHTRINPMTISQMLKVLEFKGYIYRTAHLTDVRAKVVNLTDSGKDLVNRLMKIVYDLNDRFFYVLGKDIEHFNHYIVELLNAND